MAQIICNNLTVGYEKKAVVKDLSFTVNCGDYFCIIGENGAGKSTLVKSILGLIPTICGEIIFADGLTKIVGILVALCASLLGVTLVLKRFSYIGDGLSHTAFGTLAISSICGLTNNMILTLPVTIVCAILLLKTSQNKKNQW